MRNLIEKLLADGSEYLYIVQRPGEIAVGGVRWYEPEDADKWAAEALAIAGSAVSVGDVISIANRARTRSGLPRVSTETILSAYIKAKHGGNHE